MVEYTEDDLAREMEELKLQQAAQNGGGGEGAAGEGGDGGAVQMPAGPKRRGPPRRKTGSSNLTAFNGPKSTAEGGD